MIHRFFTLAISLLLFSSTSHAISLEGLREAELTMLSVCPERSSVAVVGTPAISMMLSTNLGDSAPELMMVHRGNLSSIMFEQCSDAIDPSTQAAAGGLYFAMYLVSIETNLPGESPAPVEVRAIRTDTGAIIYSRTETLGDIDGLNSFFDEVAEEISAAVASNGYECKDQFNFILEEDVSLNCTGNVPAIQTDYNVRTSFTSQFVLPGVDYTLRNQTQSISGSTKIQPSKAKTVLKFVTHRGGDCPATIDTTRTIDFNLKETEVPTQFTLSIPEQVKNDWSVTPTLSAVPPLFSGPTNMNASIIVTSCEGGPSAPHNSPTPYKHYELNQFNFGTHSFKPVCEESSDVDPVFTVSPKFGVSLLPGNGLNCTKNSSVLTPAYRRVL